MAGYQHLSKYIRDRVMGRHEVGSVRYDSRADGDWTDRAELSRQLADMKRSLQDAHAVLAMLLVLTRRRATTGELNELVLACQGAHGPTDVLETMLPELAKALTRFGRDSV
ncbi:hypothetical protein AB4Z46_31510 [Variovorax sp. M-6]|uniref:hypothetical protein n=1 Tax=Variovorax sp. M-6 TaxID=3233041 RepID=UPI003F9692BB